jgi:hypothetical protein
LLVHLLELGGPEQDEPGDVGDQQAEGEQPDGAGDEPGAQREGRP